jgi:hypothetical protein
VLSQTTPEGDVYTEFDGDGNPGHAQFADGSSGDFTYQPDGTVRLDLSDGTSILSSGTGDHARVLSQTTPEGDVYTDFDDLGMPGHVEFLDV